MAVRRDSIQWSVQNEESAATATTATKNPINVFMGYLRTDWTVATRTEGRSGEKTSKCSESRASSA